MGIDDGLFLHLGSNRYIIFGRKSLKDEEGGGGRLF